MIYFVSTIHVLLCVFMIFVILLQPGKDAGMGAALGGGAATSAFGGRGAVTFLGKVTAVCAIGYFITSLGLSFVGLKGSVADRLAGESTTEAKPAIAAPDKPGTQNPAGEPVKVDVAPKSDTEGAKTEDMNAPADPAKPEDISPAPVPPEQKEAAPKKE